MPSKSADLKQRCFLNDLNDLLQGVSPSVHWHLVKLASVLKALRGTINVFLFMGSLMKKMYPVIVKCLAFKHFIYLFIFCRCLQIIKTAGSLKSQKGVSIVDTEMCFR